MSTDIGARIGISGEKDFRTSLSAINSQLKALNSEMKLVSSEMDNVEGSEEAVAKQTDILERSISAAAQKVQLLTKQYDAQKAKLKELETALESAVKEHGEASAEAVKAQNAYNRQVTAVNKLSSELSSAQSTLNRFSRELQDVGNVAQDVADDIEDVSESGNTFSESFKGAFTGSAIIGGIQAIAGGIANLAEQTTEYRKIMGTLDTSSEKAGYSAEQTAATYKQLNSVIGDPQAAATATANLQALQLSQEKLTQLTEGAIGAWVTYGDSIPIDNLSESINETIKAGQVTGTFADVLNWAGTNEDAFNEKLQATQDPAERANIVLQELADQGLAQTAEAWRQNNEQIVASNNATDQMTSSTAKLAEEVAPAVTSVKETMAELTLEAAEAVGEIKNMIDEGDPLIAVLTGGAVAAGAFAVAVNMGTILAGVTKGLTAMKTAVLAVNAAMAANPIGLVVSLLAGLAAALITAYNTNEEFRAKVNAAWESVKETVGEIAGMFISLFTEDFPEALDELKELFMSLPETAKEAGINAVKKLWDGISSMASWLSSKISGWLDSIFGSSGESDPSGGGGGGTSRAAAEPRKSVPTPFSLFPDDFPEPTNFPIPYNFPDPVNTTPKPMFTNVANDLVSRMVPSNTAPTNNNTEYHYGDLNIYVDHINNGSNRDVRTLAKELNFMMKQQQAGKGGVLA